MAPTASRLATRSTTVPLPPTRAAVPVRSCAGCLRCARALGRTTSRSRSEVRAKTTHEAISPPPTAETSAASSAPAAKGARKKLSVSISPTASTTAARIQTVQLMGAPSLPPNQSAGEVTGVERPEVLECLADPDQLHRYPELSGDCQRDAALGRPVELGQHDSRHRHRLVEHARLAHPVLPGGGVDRQQRLVRGAGKLLVDDTRDLAQLGHPLVPGVPAPGGLDDHDIRSLAP